MVTHLMGEGRLRPAEGGRAACGAVKEESRVTPGLLSLEVQAGSSGGRWGGGQDTAAVGPGEERRQGKLGQGASVRPALPASKPLHTLFGQLSPWCPALHTLPHPCSCPQHCEGG